MLLIKKLPHTTARELGKACRKLISTKFVLGDTVQLKTRNLYKVIENKPLWDSRVNLKYYETAVKELIFWKNNLFNKKQLQAYDLPRTVIFSDDRNFAIGAIFENKPGTHTCHKNLTMEECLESSTSRELLAIEYVLKSFAPLLQNTLNIYKLMISLLRL